MKDKEEEKVEEKIDVFNSGELKIVKKDMKGNR